MIRAVLYLRSSKDRSDVSIDAQRRALQEMAASRGMLIVGEYADAVESGKDDDRPGFQELLRDLRAPGRAWDHVLALDTSRIARRRALAILFEDHECKRHGVRVLYKSLPETDPITEMLLKSILQAMDEWHSLTSRAKGLAGMAENVRQGWRAGGRAPKGYRLEHVETGAIRDGAPVMKSRLVPDEDADILRAYLRMRAQGVKRAVAAHAAGARWPATSLIEIERNALAYAGHTVWNRAQERTEGGYVGGRKWRSREEWVIQRGTHEALISEDEANAILAQLDARRRSGGRPARRVYLLAGLLRAPDGRPWHGDGGAYRLDKGPRIKAETVEQAIVEGVIEAMQSDRVAQAIAERYRLMAQSSGRSQKSALVGRHLASIEKRIARLVDLVSRTSAPDALLRQIEALEAERERLIAAKQEAEAAKEAARAMRNLASDDVKRLLRALSKDIQGAEQSGLKAALSSAVEKVVLSPETFDAEVHFRIGPASLSGERLASPRGFEPRFTP